MARRMDNNGPPYTEAQTKIWLSWLARGMQEHGQTVFLIEQLQPSWLPTSRERAFYLLSTRLIAGVIYGLIFGMALSWFELWSSVLLSGLLGFTFGLSVGLVDSGRLLKRGLVEPRATPTRLQCLKSIFIVAGILFLVSFPLAIGGRAAGLKFGPDDELILVVLLFFFLPSFSILWGIRRAYRTLRSDIQCVETLSWSWRSGAKGCALWLIIVIIVILAGVLYGNTLGSLEGAVFILIVGAVLILLGPIILTLAALRPRVAELSAVPNQGIGLSMRCAIYGGLIAGLSCGPVLGIQLFFFPIFIDSTFVAALTAFAIALMVGLWFGGLDVFLHYILRMILCMRGHAPLNLVRFLDYAAKDLNFLQKVGGGYIFIHRMLLEHFAAMEAEAKSNPQDAPPPAAPASFGSISD